MSNLFISQNSINSINFSPSSLQEEIIQNIWCILSTVKGSVPLDRNFGISQEAIDKPYMIAMMYYKIAVQEAIEKYEKRVDIVEVKFESSKQEAIRGKLMPIVEVRIKDEYLA